MRKSKKHHAFRESRSRMQSIWSWTCPIINGNIDSFVFNEDWSTNLPAILLCLYRSSPMMRDIRLSVFRTMQPSKKYAIELFRWGALVFTVYILCSPALSAVHKMAKKWLEGWFFGGVDSRNHIGSVISDSLTFQNIRCLATNIRRCPSSNSNALRSSHLDHSGSSGIIPGLNVKISESRNVLTTCSLRYKYRARRTSANCICAVRYQSPAAGLERLHCRHGDWKSGWQANDARSHNLSFPLATKSLVLRVLRMYQEECFRNE